MKFLLIAASILFSVFSFGSHAAGGSLRYECLGNDIYKVTAEILYDCSGQTPQGIIQLNVNSLSCGQSLAGTMLKVAERNVEYCPGIPLTTCEGGSIAGYKVVTYEYQIQLPAQCNDWVFHTTISARNVTSFISNTTSLLRLEAGLNNTNGICNNSPEINNDYVILGCPSSSVSYDVNLLDPDGNTLDSYLQCPLHTDGNNNPQGIDYLSGLSCLNPIPNNNGYQFNGNSIEFDPSPTSVGVSATAVRIDEYDNGVLVGWTMMDAQIVIINNCLTDGPNIGVINESNSYNIDVEQGVQTCFTIYVTDPNFNDIVSVVPDFSNLPGATYSTIEDGSSWIIEVCFDEPGLNCNFEYYGFDLTALNEGCPNGVYSTQSFEVTANFGGQYCPYDYVITNRNPTSGIPVPALTTAVNNIHVGDSIANPPYNFQQYGPQGKVEIDYQVHMVAGNNVFLGPCISGNTGTSAYNDCIILNGQDSIHIEIGNINCGADCPVDSLVVEAKALFSCFDERIVSSVSGGVPPYTYNWNVGGNYWYGNIFDSIIDIHDSISDYTLDGDTVLWSLTVLDAAGQSKFVNGSVYGTYRFYNDLENNQIWTTANPNDPSDPPTGYHYWTGTDLQGAISGLAYPWSVYDSVNDSPPFYGATNYELHIWGSLPYWPNSGTLYEVKKSIDVESIYFDGNIDWSLDNGEIYWNGHFDNNTDFFCAQVDVYNYSLKVGNCWHNYYLDHHITKYQECFDGDINDWVNPAIIEYPSSPRANIGFSNSGGETSNNSESIWDVTVNISKNTRLVPNPTNKRFNIVGIEGEIVEIIVLDGFGKIVKRFEAKAENHDVSELESGAYFVRIMTSNHAEVLKLIKN